MSAFYRNPRGKSTCFQAAQNYSTSCEAFYGQSILLTVPDRRWSVYDGGSVVEVFQVKNTAEGK